MNGPLRSEADVDLAVEGLTRLGAKLHPTRLKNWDQWHFLDQIARHYKGRDGEIPDARVLDVGCASSPLLWNLAEKIGFQELYGIDFEFSGNFQHKNIQYEVGDLTRTRFAYGSFDVITSLSVIEHGVDIWSYFGEMSRLLNPGGLLLTSTDFWPTKISTKGVPKRKTFGLPWTIFDSGEIANALQIAQKWGLEMVEGVDFAVGEKVVKWGGREYTFLAFALRKDGQ